jgi:hypothetical protein
MERYYLNGLLVIWTIALSFAGIRWVLPHCRFSSLANGVLAFTPQTDISKYEAIHTFGLCVDHRKSFSGSCLSVVRDSKAIAVHYRENIATRMLKFASSAAAAECEVGVRL